MSIQSITTKELRGMSNSEGLILQGCGGDPQEWQDGINNLLTEAGVLKNGSKFDDIYTFKHDGLTNILFPFREDMEMDIGKFAMWRLQSHSQLGGTWLSDYVPNRLGGFLEEQKQERMKPDCPLIGQDGNVFNLMGIAARTLRQAGMADEAKEMQSRIYACDSYGSALNIMGEYVNITSVEEQFEEPEDDFGMQM